MKWFGNKDNDRIIDLSKKMEEKEARNEFSGASRDEEVLDFTNPASNRGSIEDKKKNFAKRISGMIEKLDNLSTKIYHIEQRLEVVEKKLRVNNYDESE
ncbi:MAG: hypothetical protein WDZ77_02850 [Candidatus Pacearchaeota archaeon]